MVSHLTLLEQTVHILIVQRKYLQIISECVITEIKISNNKKLFLLFIYRSPNQSREEL